LVKALGISLVEELSGGRRSYPKRLEGFLRHGVIRLEGNVNLFNMKEIFCTSV
jgi:hypothetical protein